MKDIENAQDKEDTTLSENDESKNVQDKNETEENVEEKDTNDKEEDKEQNNQDKDGNVNDSTSMENEKSNLESNAQEECLELNAQEELNYEADDDEIEMVDLDNDKGVGEEDDEIEFLEEVQGDPVDMERINKQRITEELCKCLVSMFFFSLWSRVGILC